MRLTSGVHIPDDDCWWFVAVMKVLRRHHITVDMPMHIALLLRDIERAAIAAADEDHGWTFPPDVETIGVSDLAKELGIAERTVRERCARGDYDAKRGPDRKWQIRVTSTL